jgi:uncharacterized YccA/Bax inhibitor family protein
MRTSNPTLSDKVLQRAGYGSGDAMTVNGSINKIGFLLLLLMVPAAFMWSRVSTSWEPSQAMGPALLGALGGFVFALVTIFKKTWAPVTAPLYAVCEGLFLGGLSASLNAIPRYQGLAMQAVMLTFGVLAVMLVAYRAGWIRATDKFRAGVVAATGAIALLYMVSFIMSMFGASIPFIHEGGMIGIGFSVVVVGLAALNLILDFDFIEKGSAMGAPKYMEWYGAFGLLVTLVWLYLEILRLLMKLQSRD